MALPSLAFSMSLALAPSPAPAPPAAPASTNSAETAPNPYPGKVNNGAVANYLAGRFAQVDVCAARARADEPNLEGAVTLWLAVANDGSVPEARIQATDTQNQVLLGCLIATAKTWTLPPPVGGMAQVAYTYRFAPTGGPAAAGWRRSEGPVAENALYPDTPSLGQARVPPRQVPPGFRLRRMGSSTLIVGWAIGSAGWVFSGRGAWFIPVVGPTIGAVQDGGGYGLAAFSTAVQLGGATMIGFGIAKQVRWKREQASAWQRHRMNAGLTPTRRGLRLGFGMSF